MPRAFAVALASAAIIGLASANAQDQKPSPEQKPSEQTQKGMHGMMGEGTMAQMSRMMDNCNKMMESHMQQQQPKHD